MKKQWMSKKMLIFALIVVVVLIAIITLPVFLPDVNQNLQLLYEAMPQEDTLISFTNHSNLAEYDF